jgi:hypothetical protein
MRHMGRAFSDSVWPGFRPDTVPVLYVVPNISTLLANWRGPLPAGFTPLSDGSGIGWQPVASRGAASTGTQLDGRPTAQVVMRPEATIADLVGLTAHEAFHVFQGVSARDGRRFGAGENSFLISSYPVFDATNEAGVALEGRLLKAALEARDLPRRRDLLRQFIAARETRHRRLEAAYASFETLGELNEGLAEYALVRTLILAARDTAFAWRDEARRLVARSTAALDSLTHNVTQSIRLRFYVLGPAESRLLDELAGPAWKRQLLADNLTLQDAVALVSGARDSEQAALRRAESGFALPALRARADADVARLRGVRRSQMDSLLTVEGVRLTVALDSLPGGRAGLCMIDPQNLLQADAGVLLHTRAVHICAGALLDASFTTPVVDDRRGKSVRAVIGPADSLRITTGGNAVTLLEGQSLEVTDLRVETPVLSLRSARAQVERRGRQLTINPKP